MPDHKSFVAECIDDAPAFPGRSASFLMAGERLAGMTVTEPAGELHGFVRVGRAGRSAGLPSAWIARYLP